MKNLKKEQEDQLRRTWIVIAKACVWKTSTNSHYCKI
ncbi:MAG: hypothetical protein MHMPM18_005180 [Marteilia pararefringens]